MNLYVYYRIQAGQEAACQAAVIALQKELGCPLRLLRRAEDPSTWMEVYEAVDDGFAHRLETAALSHGFPAFLASDSRRHLEAFVPCV